MKMIRILSVVVFCFSIVTSHAQISDRITIAGSDFEYTKEQGFDRIIGKSDYVTDEIGKPELPYYKVSYVLPPDAAFTGITFRVQTKHRLKAGIYVYPVQPPVSTAGTESVDFVGPNNLVYESNTPYPGKLYEVESDDIFQGYRVVTLRIFPLEYIPKSRIVNYFSDLEFNIEYEINPNSNLVRPLAQSAWRAVLARSFVKGLVRNPDDVDVFGSTIQSLNPNGTLRSRTGSSTVGKTTDYIIITSNSLKPAFQPLADWKIKKGISTIIVTVEEINDSYSGCDLSEKIRKYLIHACQKWSSGLYVLLGGDINIVPSRDVHGVDNNLSYPTDMYYSAYYSNSWNPGDSLRFIPPTVNIKDNLNVVLGRIPVSTTQEVTVYINKVIAYEKAGNLGDLNYLKNNLYADAYMEIDRGYLYNFFHSFIKSYASTYVPNRIRNKYICDNSTCKGDAGRYNSHSSIYATCSGTTNGDVELNKSNFLSLLNSGGTLGIGKFHFIYHLDHSSEDGIGASNKDKGEKILSADIDNMTNGTSYQIMFSGGCHPANFAKDCFGKHYIINPTGGVAFIGNTDVGWQEESDQLKWFLDAIYGGKTGVSTIGRYDIGAAFQRVCIKNRFEKWRLHLLGDPEMQVWTNIPKDLTVSELPKTLVTGENTITVKIDNLPTGENALVCIRKGEEDYVTDVVKSNDTYTYPFTPHTPGMAEVTVTAHNFFPKEISIPVNASTASHLYGTNIIVDDDNAGASHGNGNGKLDAGETIELSIDLKNSGKTAAAGVTGVLTCSSPFVTVTSGSYSFGAIAAGQTKRSGKYVCTIDKDATEILKDASTPLAFYLQITDNAGTTRKDSFPADLVTYDLQQRNKTIVSTNNGDKIISAGESVTIQIELQNLGTGDTDGLTAVLSSTSPYITSCSSTAITYPTIKKGEIKNAGSGFRFQVSGNYPTGGALPFTLKVQNRFGKTKTFTFDLSSRPVGINAASVKPIAFGNEIELKWTPVSGIAGYAVYRKNVNASGTIVGDFVRVNDRIITSSYIRDYKLSNTTTYAYYIATVSASGNESELSGPYKVMTTYVPKGAFPIQMNETGPVNGAVTVVDIDYDGKKELFAAVSTGSAGLIAGFHHDGSELFDIDRNVTTVSGFAKLPADPWSGVAIGDLYGTGDFQVVSGTRNTKNLDNNYVTCHATTDNDRDLLPDMLWQNKKRLTLIKGAVAANLDNSADGSEEIVLRPDRATGGKVIVLNNKGEEICRVGEDSDWAYGGAPAVADIDGDGDLEIIFGTTSGKVYAYHHDGTPYSVHPLYTNSTYYFNNSAVVCDLNNDGQKEILIVGAKIANSSTDLTTTTTIFAVKPNGTLLPGWGTTAQLYSVGSQNISKELVVGDIDNNGTLEVVALTAGAVKIWNNAGTLIRTITSPGADGVSRTPVLADIDGDAEAEIIYGSGSDQNIYAYKLNGKIVSGYPLSTGVDGYLNSTPCVADIDGNGINDIIAVKDGKIYVWETAGGKPNRIEWGSERYDHRNTGEYLKKCTPTVITTNENWFSTKTLCGDIIVKSGTLTINPTASVTMDNQYNIIVKKGAQLIVNGGKLLNVNIRALEGSLVVLKENGYVKLRSRGEFNIRKGAYFEHIKGTIDKAR